MNHKILVKTNLYKGRYSRVFKFFMCFLGPPLILSLERNAGFYILKRHFDLISSIVPEDGWRSLTWMRGSVRTLLTSWPTTSEVSLSFKTFLLGWRILPSSLSRTVNDRSKSGPPEIHYDIESPILMSETVVWRTEPLLHLGWIIDALEPVSCLGEVRSQKNGHSTSNYTVDRIFNNTPNLLHCVHFTSLITDPVSIASFL